MHAPDNNCPPKIAIKIQHQGNDDPWNKFFKNPQSRNRES